VLKKIYGKDIFKLRQTRGFSQGELAKKIGVTQATISSWELKPTKALAEKYYKKLNTVVAKKMPALKAASVARQPKDEVRKATLRAYKDLLRALTRMVKELEDE